MDHLEIIEGTAPEALEALPVPTHAFIGGSAGNLKEILELLLRKNPNIRVVLNTVTVETLAEAASCFKKLAFEEPEIVCLQASNAKKAGRSHLMIAQNPVYIFTAQGVPKNESTKNHAGSRKERKRENDDHLRTAPCTAADGKAARSV